ncbi:MAG TPA: SCP2 sterol-binding domain-containing protein [Actinomycetota bacterium]|nr:SCP2 sterol-binding domain-containing protein [Actinomycetota bacterium]
MATKTQVESKLREMIGRLAGADAGIQNNLAKALPDGRVIQIDVTDLDACYWTGLSEGRMGKLQRGEASDPDIRMRTSSDDLVAMVDGELGLVKSYLSGRIRIEASLSDLLALRKLA